MEQYIDEDLHGPHFCRPGCEHRLAIYRRGGFKPTRRGVMTKGRPNLCAVIDYDRRRYLTACGDMVGMSSISHEEPNCPHCLRALRGGAFVARPQALVHEREKPPRRGRSNPAETAVGRDVAPTATMSGGVWYPQERNHGYGSSWGSKKKMRRLRRRLDRKIAQKP